MSGMRVKYGVYCRQNHGSRDNRYDYVYLVRLSRRSDVTTKHSGDGDGKRLQNNRNRTLVFTTYRYIDYRNQRKAEYGKKYYFSVVGSKNAAQTNGYKKNQRSYCRYYGKKAPIAIFRSCNFLLRTSVTQCRALPII